MQIFFAVWRVIGFVASAALLPGLVIKRGWIETDWKVWKKELNTKT